jgi:transposase
VLLGRDGKLKEHRISNKSNPTVATMGIDIGRNSFHVVGVDQRGPIVPRQSWSRRQVGTRLASMPPCLIGMEAYERCVTEREERRR